MTTQPVNSKLTFYNGYWMRSTLEARWAKLLDLLGVDYRYEFRLFTTSVGPYLPDFYLPELNAWLEIKPYPPSPLELTKLVSVAASDKAYAFLVSGFPCELGTELDHEHETAWTGAELCIVRPNRRVLRVSAEPLLSFLDSNTRSTVVRAVRLAGACVFEKGFLKLSEALVLTGHEDWYEWNMERNRQRSASARSV